VTVPLLIVRHAYAGDRTKWTGPDELRPLTAKGRREAAGLVEVLAPFRIERILSSWFVRCTETMVHVACDRRLAIEVDAALIEGSSPEAILALARRCTRRVTVLCTHGDVIESLFAGVERELGLDRDDEPPMAKGSTWVLEADGDAFVGARYLPEPRNH
jgi:8-oxo-(d)GTP phosphatase